MFYRIFPKLEFIGSNTERPDVCLFTKLPLDDLWGHVLDGTDKGGNSSVIGLVENLRESIVVEFDMSIISNEDVLRFERAVDDVLLMQVLHADDDFGEDVFDGVF